MVSALSHVVFSSCVPHEPGAYRPYTRRAPRQTRYSEPYLCIPGSVVNANHHAPVFLGAFQRRQHVLSGRTDHGTQSISDDLNVPSVLSVEVLLTLLDQTEKKPRAVIPRVLVV